MGRGVEGVRLPHVTMCVYYHPGLAEINAPVGSQEVMPLLKDSPLKTTCTQASVNQSAVVN